MTTIVLLPGLDGTGTLYEPLRKALNGRCKLLVVTYPVDQLLDYDALEKVARAYLPTDEEYILLGESFSGPIAISIAASHPPGLRKLILCGTFARNPRPFLGGLKHMLALMPIRIVPLVLIRYFLMGKFSTNEQGLLLATALGSVSPDILQFRLRCVLIVDVRKKLGDIDVPISYLRGIRDRLVPLSAFGDIASCSASTQMIEFDAPHFILQTRPDEVVRFLFSSSSPPVCTSGRP